MSKKKKIRVWESVYCVTRDLLEDSPITPMLDCVVVALKAPLHNIIYDSVGNLTFNDIVSLLNKQIYSLTINQKNYE